MSEVFTPELTFGPYQSGVMTDDISGIQRRTIIRTFDPGSLFLTGEKGFIYDFTNKDNLSQNTAGTLPLTAAGQSIARVRDQSPNFNHGIQATGAAQPTWSATLGAVADGTKTLSTTNPVDMSATDKMTIIVACQTNTNASQGVYAHGGLGVGDAYVAFNSGVGGFYQGTVLGSTGTAQNHNSRAGLSAVQQTVVSLIGDIGQATGVNEANCRINGETYGQVVDQAGPAGTGNFASRTGTLFTYFAGNMTGSISRIIVIGRLLTVAELYAAEYWIGQGAGLKLISELPPVGPVYYNMLPTHGQSLATGGLATPVLSSVTRFNDVMFTGGIHIYVTNNYTALVPLVESTATESATSEGETPTTGAIEILHERGTIITPLIGVCIGFPALSIAQASKPGINYDNFKLIVTNGWRRSREQFKHFKIRAWCWLQGEIDDGNATYAAQMTQLQSDANTDLKAITGQTEDIWMLSYQLDRAMIGLAHLSASDNSANIRVVAPMYFLQHAGDNVHLSNLGSKLIGAYFGLAYQRIINQGNTLWQPLKCTASSVAGAVVNLTMGSAVGQLVFDTTIVAAQTNQGFRVFQSDGVTPVTITSVVIIGANVVRVTCNVSIPAGAILRYGFDSPTDNTPNVSKGNLRDSQGDTIQFNGGGLNYNMHNWCVLFQRTIN